MYFEIIFESEFNSCMIKAVINFLAAVDLSRFFLENSTRIIANIKYN